MSGLTIARTDCSWLLRSLIRHAALTAPFAWSRCHQIAFALSPGPSHHTTSAPLCRPTPSPLPTSALLAGGSVRFSRSRCFSEPLATSDHSSSPPVSNTTLPPFGTWPPPRSYAGVFNRSRCPSALSEPHRPAPHVLRYRSTQHTAHARPSQQSNTNFLHDALLGRHAVQAHAHTPRQLRDLSRRKYPVSLPPSSASRYASPERVP